MTTDHSLAAWLRCTLVPGIGGHALRKLLAEFGSPENVTGAGRAALARVIGDSLADRFLNESDDDAVAQSLAWAEASAHSIVTLEDAAYPRQLLETPDPPLLLYVRGDAALLARPALAIVGSRNATPQGLQNAERFASALSDAGVTVVSGLALGVDAAAHRGALSGRGSTVAVLGTGIDVEYPARNRELYADIAAGGVIVSEFPLGTPPLAPNFPRRNRIISGLARGVLVVEAAISSGSLITARLAAEQGRDVFAIPGSIHSPQSKGCHALIKQGAKLVESVQDVLEELNVEWSASHSGVHSGIEAAATPSGAGDGDDLLRAMGHDPCSIDALAERSGLTAVAVSAILLQLEVDGRVARLPGGQYQRLA